MGSLCCVAARPQGSTASSREWSIARNEPFWRTNSSFSPAFSRGWDHLVLSEGLSYGSIGDGGVAFCDSSMSSGSSKESRSWGRGEQLSEHRYASSDAVLSCYSSPSDGFRSRQLMPPPVQGVDISEYVRDSEPEANTLSQFVEGSPGTSHIHGSVSSRSDVSEHEPTFKTHVPSHHRDFSSCCSFMSKPVHPHPLSFLDHTSEGGAHSSIATTNSNCSPLHSDLKSIQALMELQSPSLDFGSTPHRETAQCSSNTSSIDLTDASEPSHPESLGPSCSILQKVSKCGLCEKFLSQRSPWGSRQIIRSVDMPVAGILSCWHVYHAECLERITPKAQKHDPPCPLCEKLGESGSECWAVSRSRNGFPRLRLLGEEGPSRVWSFGQVGDCVEGALHVPKQSNILLKNHSRVKWHLSLKGNLGKERGAEAKGSGMNSEWLPRGAIGCSSMTSGPALKRL